MTDYYIEAVRTYKSADKNLKHFSECCAMVDGRKTLSLAQDCKVSVDTIENYRNAYVLYKRLEINLETSEPARIWGEVNIALWVKAAKLQKQYALSNDAVMDYLQTACAEGMSRESFSAHVDEKENSTPKWIRRIKHAISILFPVKNDWKTEIPAEKRDRFEQLVVEFEAGLQELLQPISEVTE